MVGSRKKTLIKVSEVKKITGWNKYQMEKARKLGWVEHFRKNGGIFYIYESITNPYAGLQNNNKAKNG